MHVGRGQGERGSQLVEAAMIVPVLLLLLAIVADLGSAFYVAIEVIEAAREGARYGVHEQNSTQMCARAMAVARLPPGVTLSCNADAGHGSGTPVRVTVSCGVPTIMGGLTGRSSIPISHTAAFRIR